MTVKIQSETGVEIAKYNNAKFRHNEETATAAIWNDHGQAELEWVQVVQENIYEADLLPDGLPVKIIIE